MRSYRTIWVSDFHLGTHGCQAERLLSFLRETESEYLYLVGDIVDGWALAKGWYWPAEHNTVVQKILRIARKGTRVTYIPGNHDAFARQYCGLAFGDIMLARSVLHETADGRCLLVLHGDEFDGAVALAPWLSKLGASIYQTAIALNRPLNTLRRLVGRPYWSLAGFLKQNTKKAVQYIAGFEETVATRACDRGVDGIVCGHIHKAELRQIGGVTYANSGDWVEGCTALVEHNSGRLEVIHWPQRGALTPLALYAGDGLENGLPTLSRVTP